MPHAISQRHFRDRPDARPSSAVANGGPVEWTDRTAEGSILPLEQSKVRLDSQDLEIKLADDGVHYTVAARYHVENPEAPVTLQYGVPMVAADAMTNAESSRFERSKGTWKIPPSERRVELDRLLQQDFAKHRALSNAS